MDLASAFGLSDDQLFSLSCLNIFPAGSRASSLRFLGSSFIALSGMS